MVVLASPNGKTPVDVLTPGASEREEPGYAQASADGAPPAPYPARGPKRDGSSASEAAPGPLRTWFADLRAGLLVTAPVAPTLGCLFTVALYSPPATVPLDPLAGLALIVLALPVFLAGWLVLALPYSIVGITKADRVNSSSFSELLNRVGEARVWCQASGHLGLDTAGESINRAIHGQLDEIEDALNHQGLCWIFGIQYITLWRKLHMTEALLAYIEPRHRLLSRTEKIRARIADSKMVGATHTVGQLAGAEAVLSRGDDGGGPPAASANDVPGSDMEARATIGQIQRSIDDVRTDSYAGLLAARNLLLSTCAATGLFLYALLWLAILAKADASRIQAAAGFYFVGALVGLFGLLYLHAGAGSAVDDYGLTRARLFVAPQLSGIAAVMGVVITAMVAATQVSSPGSGPDHPNLLMEAFNMLDRPVNVLVAAIFAFSPGLVFDRLRRQTEGYKEDLRSSRDVPRRRTG